MNFKNISIIGIGLIGSSVALALKKRGFSGTITGVGRNEDNLLRAKELGIIDISSTSYTDGIQDADLIMLAVPVGQFEPIVKSIREELKPGTIISDVGSVKAAVLKKLEPLMPEGVYFVGGHPIAGKECPGLDAASADLFDNARCIITPSAETNRNALEKITDLWNTIGSRTVIMDPEEHDLIFAAVSHLPHVVAYALINSIMAVDGNIIHHGGTGLKDMTRISLSPPELWRDICSFNKESVLKTLHTFSSSISRLTKLIEESDWTGLEKEFYRAKEARQIIESD